MCVALLCGASFGVGALPSRGAEASVSREDQLKAAYLFNFLKFVHWQASPPEARLTVCFVDAPTVYVAFAQGIERKRAGNHALDARLLDRSADLAGCHAVFIAAACAAEIAPALRGSPVLTVSDAREFTARGGIIELFAENNRLRFTINVANAERAQLKISSNLLQLAATVERGEGS